MQAVHTFIIQRSSSQGPFTVYTRLNNGTTVPQYHVEASESKPNLKISRIQPTPAQHSPQPWSNGSGQSYHQPPPQPQGYMPANPYNYSIPSPSQVPIGTVSLSSISSKITFSIHDISERQMKRPHFLASGHSFSHPQLGTLEWKEDDLIRKRFKLVDQNKTVLARFDKWKSQQETGSILSTMLSERKKPYTFLVFVNADPELLDWIVVSGLGVVEYRIFSDKEWEELADNLFM